MITRKILLSKEIKEKIESAFQRNAILDARGISIEIHADKIILNGVVHCFAEKREAEKVACIAPGICKIENNIVIID